MIPYAELINHENVDVEYDYVDKEGKTIACMRESREKERKEERLLMLLKRKVFFEDLKVELIKMEQDLKTQIEGKEKVI
jgi:hypothetical protein